MPIILVAGRVASSVVQTILNERLRQPDTKLQQVVLEELDADLSNYIEACSKAPTGATSAEKRFLDDLLKEWKCKSINDVVGLIMDQPNYSLFNNPHLIWFRIFFKGKPRYVAKGSEYRPVP